MNQKGSIKNFAFVVVIVLFVGAAGYLYLKNPETIRRMFRVRSEETADWKTHRNVRYGYEIKYPKTLYLVTQGLGGVGNVRLTTYPEGKYPPRGGMPAGEANFDLIVYDGVDLSKKLQEISRNLDPGMYRVDGHDLILNGNIAKRLVYTERDGFVYNVAYLLQNGDVVYFLSATVSKSVSEQFREGIIATLDQMVTTVRFSQ